MSRPGQYLVGATIASGETLYAGQVNLELAGATISETTLYAGRLNMGLNGAFIESTAALYAGSIPYLQFLEGAFIGLGQPRAIQGAFIDATTALYEGVVTDNYPLEGAFIDAVTELFAGVMGAPVITTTGGLFPGTIAHV